MEAALFARLKKIIRPLVPAPVVRILRQRRSERRVRRRFGRGRRTWSVLAGSAMTVLFVPDIPLEDHVAFKLCALLGHRMTVDPTQPFDVAFKHARGTHTSPHVLDDVPRLPGQVVNASSIDVSKRHVQDAFREVFGYDLAVDPTTCRGPMVEKSDKNAQHDGRILQGPIEPGAVRPDSVYQRLIDNASRSPGLVLDYRVPIQGDVIPLVYLKHRSLETRFQSINSFVELSETSDVFRAEEVEKLIRLARVLGIDYGEFDVLRDRDGLIYVVDAANTPAGPPNGLPMDDARFAMTKMAASFDVFLRDWMEHANTPMV
jgi:hypothetical protein